ncbi:MAG TPA: ATP-binding protein [Vicinamibacterales bacterium]|jgi:heavy metal sensor kinase
MRPLSLRARLTLWYTLALLVALALVGADVLWQQRRIGLRRVDRDLDALAGTLTNVMRDELTENPTPRTAAEEARNTVTAPGRAIAILDNEGATLAARWNGLPPQGVLPGVESGPIAVTVTAPAGAWRVHAVPQSIEKQSLILIVASPLNDVLREQHEAQEALVVGIPIAIVLSAVIGWWLASIGLRPITDMADRAARIPLTGLEDLGQTNRTDELGRLADTFNALVARLRSALVTQRQFMADASHELRTPVSVVSTAADVLLSREHRDESEYREALAIVGGQARRLGHLVEDMLVLARADAGGYPLRPVALYLDELVADSRRGLDVLALERGVTIRADHLPETPFEGDEELLRRLVVNLLQNAVQHTPGGGEVVVTIDRTSRMIDLRVADGGPGIPAADRERIFDRFVQLDQARRAQGTGLGLPIARWIAQVHSGTLVLKSSGPSGSTFEASFPVATD